MRAPQSLRRRAGAFGTVAVALAAMLAVGQRPALADDRDLLRFDSAKPYLFILLDTSASMSLGMGEDLWTPGSADGPGSRLYQAKQALYNVLADVDDVHYGFASYNQDGAHVTGKHYLYYNPTALPSTTTSWGIAFPVAETVDADGDGSVLTQLVAVAPLDDDGNELPIPADATLDTRELEITGHVLTFGSNTGTRQAGTCASPLELDEAEDLAVLQGLPIDGVGAGGTAGTATRFWIESGNRTHLLEAWIPGTKDDGTTNTKIGDSGFLLKLQLRRVGTGNSCSTTLASVTFDSTFGTRSLNLQMASDSQLFETLLVDGQPPGNGADDETVAGIVDFSDVFSTVTYLDDDAPFTGKGWEGNYDSGVVTEDADIDSEVTSLDLVSGTVQLKHVEETRIDQTLGRPMDYGDVIPFHWEAEKNHQDDFLRRLDPNHEAGDSSPGDFRIARLFADTAVAGVLPLDVTAAPQPPLVAADRSPLAKAINDFRCWYLGDDSNGNNKCVDTVFEVSQGPGWEEIACEKDSEFGCRRPYLIIISDGEDSGGRGEDANADVAALNSKSGIRTWALNLGDPRGCDSGGGLHPIVRAGKGECINVETQETLRQTLESILGAIRTEARSFASAAVPSVQATVEQKIFLTSFVPLNDSSVWDGHVHSFLKPLPTVDASGRPATEAKCDGTGDIDVEDPSQGCHLWDAGEVLHDSQYPAMGTTFLDMDDPALRRVFHAARLFDTAASTAPAPAGPGEWPARLRLFTELDIDTADSRKWRYDLWNALELEILVQDDSGDPHANDATESKGNEVVVHTLSEKQGTVSEVDPDTGDVTTSTITFLLGDIFHSTPIVVGTPPNTTFFAGDLYGNGVACDEDSGTANPGYRCFFAKQRLRRKMLLVGSNDGMLHAFDAGVFRSSGEDHFTGVDLENEFDNGTGKELFAFIPRQALPTLKGFLSTEEQSYTVDGTITVADVFIDPIKQASSNFPEPADRQWRTVVIGGLREGGIGYYALDVTQPDPVEPKAQEEDPFDFVPSNHDGANGPGDDYIPECLSALTVDGNGAVPTPGDTACGPAPFPSVVWEFDDSYFHSGERTFLYADEEGDTGLGSCALVGNGEPDLGASWSVPNVGRIRICQAGGTECNPNPVDPTDDDDLVDRFVAIFGGGMDTENKSLDWRSGIDLAEQDTLNVRGNWLYMVDIETGQVLYKQALEGAVPSEPAAVDVNGDGYLDRIYVGTTAGFLYRVDLTPVAGELPAPETLTRLCVDSGSDPTASVANQQRLPADVWQPVKIFDANFDGATPTGDGVIRSIYHRPSVFFQAGTGQYGLAFGTGDREDLWTVEGATQRFYVFIDAVISTDDVTTPLNEGSLQVIDADLSSNTVAANYLTSTGGWSMVLGEDQRVITDGFALSGLMIFSAFTPQVVDQDGTAINVGCGDEGNQGGGGGGGGSDDTTCSKQGTSAIFVVNTTNANGLLFDSDSAAIRFKEVPTFVTNPFAEPGQTKRAGDPDSDQDTADDLTEDLIAVMESLKGLFPAQCKFANYRVDVKTVAADTSLQFIAPVPVCILERNWKEF